MSLTEGRNTKELASGGRTVVVPVKANTKIFAGGLVMIDGGYAVAGKKAVDLITIGRAEEDVDNTGTGGTNGAKNVTIKRGAFKYDNDTTNPVTQADIFKNCYVHDDETVSMLDTGASVAGKVIGLDDDEVIVEII